MESTEVVKGIELYKCILERCRTDFEQERSNTMAVCENCGREFDVSDAKWDFDHSFGKGAYEEHYPYHDM